MLAASLEGRCHSAENVTPATRANKWPARPEDCKAQTSRRIANTQTEYPSELPNACRAARTTCRRHGRLADLGENQVFLTDRPLIALLLSLMLTGLQRACALLSSPDHAAAQAFIARTATFFCSKTPFDPGSLHPRAYAQTPGLTDFSVAPGHVKSSPAIPHVRSASPLASLAQFGPLKTND